MKLAIILVVATVLLGATVAAGRAFANAPPGVEEGVGGGGSSDTGQQQGPSDSGGSGTGTSDTGGSSSGDTGSGGGGVGSTGTTGQQHGKSDTTKNIDPVTGLPFGEKDRKKLGICKEQYYDGFPCGSGSKTSPTHHKQNGSSGGISLSTPSSGVLVPYINPDYKISIQYPSHWKISETNLGSHQVVKFSAPEVTQKETKVYYVVFTPAFLIISVEPLASNNTTLDQHISQFFTIGYHNNPSNYKIVNSSGTVLAGIPAKKLTMYDYMNNHTYEVIRVIGVDNGTAYRIAYYAEPGTFTTYLPVIQQMISSFRINLVN